MSDHKQTRSCPETTHIRVRRSSVQRLRLAIIELGGVFHGTLTREASIALERHADSLLEEANRAKDDEHG